MMNPSCDSTDLVSLILPVYRVEQYLERCLESIFAQTYTHFEVILVDDGSPDRSGEICDRYAARDARVRVIHQKNSGVSSARNAGLAAARGDYILFVDSDDYIAPTMIETLVDLIHETRADVASCTYRFDGGPAWEGIRPVPDGSLTVYGREDAIADMLNCIKLSYSPCDKLFSRKCLEGVFFHTDITQNEDLLFCYQVFCLADKIVYRDEALYIYCVNAGSASHSRFNAKRMTAIDAQDLILEDIAKRFPGSTLWRVARREYVKVNIYTGIGMARDDYREKTHINRVRRNVFRHLPTLLFSSLALGYKINGLLMVFCPPLFRRRFRRTVKTEEKASDDRKDSRPKIFFLLRSMNVGGTEKALLNYLHAEELLTRYDVTVMLCEKTGGFLPYLPSGVSVVEMPHYREMAGEMASSPVRLAGKALLHARLRTALSYCRAYLDLRKNRDGTRLYAGLFRECQQPRYGGFERAVVFEGPDNFLTSYLLAHVSAERYEQWIHFDVSRYSMFSPHYAAHTYSRFSVIHTVSEQCKAALLDALPGCSVPVDTVISRVSASLCRKMAEEGRGFSDGFTGKRILTIGRLSEEKGQEMIPDVMALLAGAGLDCRWYLLGEGNTKDSILSLAEARHIADRLVFLGVDPNPYRYLAECDLYVQTSKHEGFGMTLAEAKVFDLPIVSTDVTGAHEQLCDYPGCRIVSRDADRMAEAIRTILCCEA